MRVSVLKRKLREVISLTSALTGFEAVIDNVIEAESRLSELISRIESLSLQKKKAQEDFDLINERFNQIQDNIKSSRDSAKVDADKSFKDMKASYVKQKEALEEDLNEALGKAKVSKSIIQAEVDALCERRAEETALLSSVQVQLKDIKKQVGVN